MDDDSRATSGEPAGETEWAIRYVCGTRNRETIAEIGTCESAARVLFAALKPVPGVTDDGHHHDLG